MSSETLPCSSSMEGGTVDYVLLTGALEMGDPFGFLTSLRHLCHSFRPESVSHRMHRMNRDILLFPSHVVSRSERLEGEHNEGAGSAPARKFRMSLALIGFLSPVTPHPHSLERDLHDKLLLLRRFDCMRNMLPHPFDRLLAWQIEKLLGQAGGKEAGPSDTG